MPDIISNDIGAFVATLFGLWLYTHVLSEHRRRELGRIARWLAHGARLLLQRRGRAIGVVACAAFAGVLFLAQWIDRGEPALASGLPSGQSRSWNFVEDPSGDTLVLAGDWVADARGICRENLRSEERRVGKE